MKSSSLLSLLAACGDKCLSLLPYVFEPLPLGSIRPQGWLFDTLRLMGDGLAGHEYDFYSYVKDSTWRGRGEEYSPLREAAPYWFNYIVPLAYGLDDARLKLQVRDFVEKVIDGQGDDGWLGPEPPTEDRDLWARFPLVLGLTQLLEADPSYETTLLPCLYRFVRLLKIMLEPPSTGLIGWGQARAYDMVLSLQWLHEKYPEHNTKLLFDTMELLKKGAFNWPHFFSEGTFPKGNLDNWDGIPVRFDFVHVVNLGQALKSSAVIRRFMHDEYLLETARNAVNWTYLWHGAPSGAIIGDERIAGVSPARGAELCGVVESLFSLSYLYKAVGDNAFADRAELAAFNALPAMTTPDFWAHQYVAQTNQPYSIPLEDTPFWNVNQRGQTFGLEPHFPCCTVNHPQGFPKFVSALFVRVGRRGIGHALLSPAIVTTTLGDGTDVTIKCSTNYPFGTVLHYAVQSSKPWLFYVRIPEWTVANKSYFKVDDGEEQLLRPDTGSGMQEISLDKGNVTVVVHLGADIRVEPRSHDAVAIHHGALLYALEIGTEVTSYYPKDWQYQRPLPEYRRVDESRDYIMLNTTAWAVAIDPSTLKLHSPPASSATPGKLPPNIWDVGASPVCMTALACEIDWGFANGVPAEPPIQDENSCIGDAFEVRLIPYGAAKIRIAEFPVANFTNKLAPNKNRARHPGSWRGVEL
ncbi:MAG: hypothetical protein M1825_006521 [Sarcosagium campestre]|nr:MAG: hypothetical protein M1825_006521 [Sarcosagium campestre]